MPSSRCDLPLCPCLLAAGGQGQLPKLEIILTTSDEVLSLRRQLADALAQIDDLRAQLNRTEYLYRCETIINSRLVDLCRAEHVSVPKSLYERPY